jgi:hypothetical protein
VTILRFFKAKIQKNCTFILGYDYAPPRLSYDNISNLKEKQ